MRQLRIAFAMVLQLSFWGTRVSAQAFPPGTFSVDGVPVVCGGNTFIVTPGVPDVGMNNGRGEIYINPYIINQLPTTLKLYWIAHECGHSVVGSSEVAADCWAIRTGRDQGWFPPPAFAALAEMFKNNPGDMTHPTGPQRVQNMVQCYQT